MVVRRLTARLAADNRSSHPGRTLRSILEQLLDMDQSGLDAVVSLYDTRIPRDPSRSSQVDPVIAAMSYRIMSPQAKGLLPDEGCRTHASVAAGSADGRPAGLSLASPPTPPGSSGDPTLSAGAATLWKAVLSHAHCPPAPKPHTGGVIPRALATGDAQADLLPDSPTSAGRLQADTVADEPGDTAPEATDAAAPAAAKYCTICLLWLNGPKQLDSHQIGREHRRWDALGGKLGPLPEHAPDRNGAGAPDAGGGDGPALDGGVAAAGPLAGRRLQ